MCRVKMGASTLPGRPGVGDCRFYVPPVLEM